MPRVKFAAVWLVYHRRHEMGQDYTAHIRVSRKVADRLGREVVLRHSCDQLLDCFDRHVLH
jgi:hypothetical protein